VDVKDKDGTLVHKTKMLFLRLRIVATGEHVAVVNCHLDSRKNAAGVAVRAQQSELMLTKLAEFAKSASAIIICGDLNATRGERCHDCIL
jgi:endonuclease/exonuclease/phosphatase family metal-dependent hydrolase